MKNLMSLGKSYAKQVISYVQKDHILPFLLMVNAIVFFLSWVMIKTTTGYMIAGLYAFVCSYLYYYSSVWHQDILQKLYYLFGIVGLIFALGVQMGVLGGYLPIIGRSHLLFSMLGLTIFAIVIAYTYIYLVGDGEKDIVMEHWNTWEILALCGVAVVFGVLYYLNMITLLPSLWFVSVCFVIIRKGSYRLFALGALACLLMTMAFLLLPNEPNANIAAIYCYYYLCATVLYALVL